MSRFLRISAAAAVAAFAAGCPGEVYDDEQDPSVEHAVDALDVAEAELAMMIQVMEATGAADNAEAAAAAAAADVAEDFSPEGCATATAAGPVVTYELSGCSGRYGQADVTGALSVIFDFDGGGLGAELIATDLAVDGMTVDILASVDYSVSAAGERITTSLAGMATGPRGTEMMVECDFEVLFDAESTFSFGGTMALTINRSTFTVEIADIAIDGDGCPADGGTLVFSGPRYLDLTVELTGSETATWSTSEHSGEIELGCVP